MELIFKASDTGKVYKITKLYAALGAELKAGAPVLKAEAGKINTVVKMERAGVLTSLFAKESQEIRAGFVIGEVLYEEPPVRRDTGDTDVNHADGDHAAADQASSKRVPDFSIFGRKEEISCEIAIIGAGPGGYEAAIYAAKHGKKVVLIEKEYVGGTCLNQGCIPTKAIVNSAEKYHMVKSAGSVGISCREVSYDMEKIIDHKDQVVEQLRYGIESLLEKNEVRYIKGTASFISDKELQVVQGMQQYRVTADAVIIAAGSSIAKLPIPGIGGKQVLNSATALNLKESFQSVAIIGGGVIGMEFAGIYASLGKEVHVLEYEPRILSGTDSDLVDVLLEDLGKEIHIRTGVKVKELKESENGQCIVCFEKEGRERYLVTDKVLAAVGRVANIEGLKLENTHVKLTGNGKSIEVGAYMETSSPGVYAIGDVTGRMQLAHVASHQGFTAVDHILGQGRAMNYDHIPSVIFSRVELACVGKSEMELKKEEKQYRVSRFPFAANGKAQSMEEGKGFVKLISDPEDGRILGGAVAGPDASNLISIIGLGVSNGLTVQDVIHTVFPHPTLGEAIHEAALGLGIGAIHDAQ